jgi:hypothetical protein
MTRIVLVLALCLALAPGATAQDMSGLEIRDLPKTTVTPAEAAQLWTEVSGLSAVQAAQLLDQITGLASAKNADVSSLSAHSMEVARQYGVFRDAHAHAAGGQGADVEALYAQVFEGKAAADVPHLGRVAAGYFTLHHNYSQLVTARFLATNATDPSIAEAAGARAATYETNVLTAVAQLKGLLALERR